MDILRPVLDQIGKLWARLELMPVIRWGAITQADPLRVQLDGDLDPMVLTPMTLVAGLGVGDRVLCVEQHRRVIVLGRAKGWGTPFAMAAGSTNTPASGYATITFPAGRFTHPPIVTASGGTQSQVAVSRVVSVTPTSFQIAVWSVGSVQVAGANVDWHAVQMSSGGGAG